MLSLFKYLKYAVNRKKEFVLLSLTTLLFHENLTKQTKNPFTKKKKSHCPLLDHIENNLLLEHFFYIWNTINNETKKYYEIFM